MRSARHCLKGIRIARAERGFSLIEVLLAMLIIGIGVLGLSQAFTCICGWCHRKTV